jgi:hypothetical protein
MQTAKSCRVVRELTVGRADVHQLTAAFVPTAGEHSKFQSDKVGARRA